jgi:lysozyme
VSKAKVAALAVVLIAAPFVAVEEGVVLKRYADPVGVDTACIGETDEEVVGFKQVFTRDECVAVMGASLYAHAMKLEPCVKRDISRQQAAAILSWSYNVGVGNACGSTLMRKLNAGQPFCAEFDRWVYAKGVYLRGLAIRRAQERHMCETGAWQ